MILPLLLPSLLAPQHDEEPLRYWVIMRQQDAGTAYEEAARRLLSFRSQGGVEGAIGMWESQGWAAMEPALTDGRPTWLALVLPPEDIDANLPRRLIPILTKFDDDPFVDCAFGIITGATGEDALRFVENIIRASEADLPLRKFEATSVVVDRCRETAIGGGADPVRRPLEGSWLWLTGADPSWRDFLAGHRHLAEGCGLIEWGHCGDSQGIWLFSMYRNREKEKHWRYDPDKVGWDPDGEMPRLTPADLLEGVDLFPAVVVNGACHSGVTRDTIVQGDIVSTFGDTGGRVRIHPIRPEESFPLQAIAHGATAYLAPLAANNANRAAIEMWMIREGGTPLGEVMKRTYDELILGSKGLEPSFVIFKDGEAEDWESPMYHDSFHRVLFGDPAFTPWKEKVATSHEVESRWEEGRLLVEVRYTSLAGDPWVWDPWLEVRDARGERGRIYERIPLQDFPEGEPRVEVLEAAAIRTDGEKPLALEAFAVMERDLRGRPVLHLKAGGARGEMQVYGPGGPDALRASFAVRFE